MKVKGVILSTVKGALESMRLCLTMPLFIFADGDVYA